MATFTSFKESRWRCVWFVPDGHTDELYKAIAVAAREMDDVKAQSKYTMGTGLMFQSWDDGVQIYYEYRENI